MKKKQYYTATELAQLLKVDYETIKKAIQKGEIKAYRFAGGWWRIPVEEAEKLFKDYSFDPNIKWYRPSQVAKMIGVSPDTVRYWIETGKVEAKKALSGYLLIPENEVKRILREYGCEEKLKN